MKNAPTFNYKNKSWFNYMAILSPFMGATCMYSCEDGSFIQTQPSDVHLKKPQFNPQAFHNLPKKAKLQKQEFIK